MRFFNLFSSAKLVALSASTLAIYATLFAATASANKEPSAAEFAEQFFDDEERLFLEDKKSSVAPAAANAVVFETSQEKPVRRQWYSAGGWSTLHQGPGNRDQARGARLHESYTTWQALEGISLMIAPSVSPGKTRFYQTTGQGKGKSNLYALSMEGEILWQSKPWTDASNGVDPCAVLSNVIVDVNGDLYLGDCNQMFAFDPDGNPKWVVPLPAP